jgi:hypothetical protein
VLSAVSNTQTRLENSAYCCLKYNAWTRTIAVAIYAVPPIVYIVLVLIQSHGYIQCMLGTHTQAWIFGRKSTGVCTITIVYSDSTRLVTAAAVLGILTAAHMQRTSAAFGCRQRTERLWIDERMYLLVGPSTAAE